MKALRFISVGFGNVIAANHIITVASLDAAPVRRLVSAARDRGALIDATQGRRTRAVVVTDSGHVVLSAFQPETITRRLEGREGNKQQ